MLRDKDCTISLALSGAVVPAGIRALVADLLRLQLVNVIVSTGASMVHDAIEALRENITKEAWQLVASVMERLGKEFKRISYLQKANLPFGKE